MYFQASSKKGLLLVKWNLWCYFGVIFSYANAKFIYFIKIQPTVSLRHIVPLKSQFYCDIINRKFLVVVFISSISTRDFIEILRCGGKKVNEALLWALGGKMSGMEISIWVRKNIGDVAFHVETFPPEVLFCIPSSALINSKMKTKEFFLRNE